MKLASPGPEHEALAGYTGEWDLTVTMGGKSSSGKATSRMTTAGRFLFIEFATEGQAPPFEGTFTLGFDRRHNRYDLMATDNYGTYFVTSHGKADPETGKVRLLGKDDDPHMAKMGLTKEFLHVADLREKDKFSIEVWFIDTRTEARREIKSMTVAFERR